MQQLSLTPTGILILLLMTDQPNILSLSLSFSLSLFLSLSLSLSLSRFPFLVEKLVRTLKSSYHVQKSLLITLELFEWATKVGNMLNTILKTLSFIVDL